MYKNFSGSPIFYCDTETVTFHVGHLAEYEIPENLHDTYKLYEETALKENATKFLFPHLFQGCDDISDFSCDNLRDFLEWVRSRTTEIYNKRTAILYFHNLKFDGSHICYYLQQFGLPYTTVNNVLIKNGMWYSLDIIYKGVTFQLRDSLKLITLPLSKFQDAFGLSVGKQEEKAQSWKKNIESVKSVNYQLRHDENFMIYSMYDIYTLREGLRAFWKECGCRPAQYLTAAQTAFKSWESTIKDNGYTNGMDEYIEGKFREGKKEFVNIALGERLNTDLVLAANYTYRGGICYLNPDYRSTDIKDRLYYLDYNSLYPSAMIPKTPVHDKRNKITEFTHYYPIGTPQYYQDWTPKEEILYDRRYVGFYKIECEAILKKNTAVPFMSLGRQNNIGFKLSRVYKTNEFLKTVNETFWINSIDLRMLLMYYNVKKIKFIESWIYPPAQTSNTIFLPYIKYWGKIKEEAAASGNKALKQVSKIMLNSLYGKFGQSVLDTETNFTIIDGCLHIEEMLVSDEISQNSFPIASCITAYAREQYLDIANQCRQNEYIYGDTDSVVMTEKAYNRIVKGNNVLDSSKFGFWDLEHAIKRGKFLHQKCYMLTDTNGETEVKCAGASKDVKSKITYENFEMGVTVAGAVMLKGVQGVGGQILEARPFTIKMRY